MRSPSNLFHFQCEGWEVVSEVHQLFLLRGDLCNLTVEFCYHGDRKSTLKIRASIYRHL